MSHKSTVERPGKGKALVESLADYVVIDLETTGYSPADCGITEFGAVRVQGGRVVESFSGSFTNVMGLPAERVRPWLAAHGLLA